MAAGTATPRAASDRRSTRRSVCSKDCSNTRQRKVRRPTSLAHACEDRSTSSSAACSDRDQPDRSSERTARPESNRRGPRFRSPRAGTTTSCGHWTTCGGPASHPTSAWPRRSIWCGRSATNTGVGRSRTRIRVRCTSRWKPAPASLAAGTPFEPSACCAGRVRCEASDFPTLAAPALARPAQIGLVYENQHLQERVRLDAAVRRDRLARLEERSVQLLEECPVCGACYDMTPRQIRDVPKSCIVHVVLPH